MRHDKLGVNEALINIQSAWERKRLTGAQQFLPLLDQVAKNEIYMHMARERAAQLAEAIRARKSERRMKLRRDWRWLATVRVDRARAGARLRPAAPAPDQSRRAEQQELIRR